MARFNSSTSLANLAESFSWVTSAAISRQGRVARETAGFNITDPLETVFFSSWPGSTPRFRACQKWQLRSVLGEKRQIPHPQKLHLSQFRQLYRRSDYQTRGESREQYQGARDRTTGKTDRLRFDYRSRLHSGCTADPAEAGARRGVAWDQVRALRGGAVRAGRVPPV